MHQLRRRNLLRASRNRQRNEACLSRVPARQRAGTDLLPRLRARLGRSALAKEKSREEDPRETQRRLRSMLNPHGAKMRQRVSGFSKLSLGALLLAVIIQMLRSPHLPVRPKDPAWSTQINMDLENAATDPRVGVLRYSDEQVNAYLAYTLQSKQVALTKSFLKCERAVVDFQEGFCEFAVERSPSACRSLRAALTPWRRARVRSPSGTVAVTLDGCLCTLRS